MKMFSCKWVGFILALASLWVCSCTRVDQKTASSDAEALAISKLPAVSTWYFDSLKCPLFTPSPNDSVAEIVEWYSFAPTSKRVFSINSNTLEERLYPQGDHANYQESFDSLPGKYSKDVRYAYVSPYTIDTLLSPVKIGDCKWWYKIIGGNIYGFKAENEICYAVKCTMSATTNYVSSTFEKGRWARESTRPYVGEQKANIEAIKQARALAER